MQQQQKPITNLRPSDIIGGKNAYIETAQPLHAPGQMWRMMAPARMIAIFEYGLNKYRFSPYLKEIINAAIAHLQKQKP